VAGPRRAGRAQVARLDGRREAIADAARVVSTASSADDEAFAVVPALIG
jgi:hypothetical protein